MSFVDLHGFILCLGNCSAVFNITRLYYIQYSNGIWNVYNTQMACKTSYILSLQMSFVVFCWKLPMLLGHPTVVTYVRSLFYSAAGISVLPMLWPVIGFLLKSYNNICVCHGNLVSWDISYHPTWTQYTKPDTTDCMHDVLCACAVMTYIGNTVPTSKRAVIGHAWLHLGSPLMFNEGKLKLWNK